MLLVLKRLAGPVTGETYCLAFTGTVTVGRSNRCAVVLDGDATVSRRHATLTACRGRKRAYARLADAGSTNGTMVNGEPLAAPRRLRPRDRILIGSTELLVCGSARS